MNEQIKQLAIDAGGHGMKMSTIGLSLLGPDSIQKFAELLIQKCVAICQNIDGEDNIDARSGRQDCAVEILEHFGVES